MDNNTKIFLGFLSGLAAGVIAGILLAPEKGDETRKMLMEKAKHLSDEQIIPRLEKVNELTKALGEAISSTLNEYSDKLFHKSKKESNENA